MQEERKKVNFFRKKVDFFLFSRKTGGYRWEIRENIELFSEIVPLRQYNQATKISTTNKLEWRDEPPEKEDSL